MIGEFLTLGVLVFGPHILRENVDNLPPPPIACEVTYKQSTGGNYLYKVIAVTDQNCVVPGENDTDF